MGTRSKLNPVKSLSVRKADMEGQMSDVLAGDLLSITLDARLHRRGQTQVGSMSALLSKLMECRGEVSSRTKTLTEDRRYGKAVFLEFVQNIGLSSIFNMP